MSTLSGATANKLMTNTWLDSKISPQYTKYPFLTFSITWKLTYGTRTSSVYATRTCKYNAISVGSDHRIIYGVTSSTYSAGITDANFNSSVTSHYVLSAWSEVLSQFYLPIISGNVTIGNLLEYAEFQVATADDKASLAVGSYTLAQLQNAISSKGTITANNTTAKTTLEKDFIQVTNAGVKYGGNCISNTGTPPSTITKYINGEENSSKRVITEKDFYKIFTGTNGTTNKCVREDINLFNEVTYYPVIGEIYTTYYGPKHNSNVSKLMGGVDLKETSSPILIPPTMSGLDYWNNINVGYCSAMVYVYLSLNRGGSTKNQYIGYGDGYGDGTQDTIRAMDIAWNYSSNKERYTYTNVATSGNSFFRKYVRGDNDASGAALGASVTNGPVIAKGRKIYPGDIYGREPYITPSILMDSSYDIYKVSYLPYSDAVQYYKHPTMNRNLTSSDGLDVKNGNAVVPVVYIPSTIRLYSSGTCSVSVKVNSSGYHIMTASFTSNRPFYVYKYAFGNRTAVTGNNSLQRVREDEIYDIDAFLSQLNSGSKFEGKINYTQVFNGTSRQYTEVFTPTVTWIKSTDTSGYLVLYATAQSYSDTLYNGYNPQSTTIGTSTITLNSTGVNGFLVGAVSSSERTTDTITTVWSGSGGGTTSASLTNVIGDFDYE